MLRKLGSISDKLEILLLLSNHILGKLVEIFGKVLRKLRSILERLMAIMRVLRIFGETGVETSG